MAPEGVHPIQLSGGKLPHSQGGFALFNPQLLSGASPHIPKGFHPLLSPWGSAPHPFGGFAPKLLDIFHLSEHFKTLINSFL